jgi:lipopolysaccharide transport system ATP-binding protein
MFDIEFLGVSKRYRVAPPQQTAANWTTSIRQMLARRQDFWALRDVSFGVRPGETLGIIGRNGAGKSTLLKLMSKITRPTTGRMRLRGRVSALIEVGAGFHPELTGRENIYLTGAILGMSRAEITSKLSRIIDFSDIGQFIDVPVKRYSSGMYVRLGFSIAAHLDSDIMLLDEVLAVGDAAFQTKCAAYFSSLRRSGKTVLFVSHDLGIIERLCDRAILLERGVVRADTTPAEAIRLYQSVSGSDPSLNRVRATDGGGERAEILSAEVLDANGASATQLSTGRPVRIRIRYRLLEPVSDVSFHVDFRTPDDILLLNFMTEERPEKLDLEAGEGMIEFVCPHLPLGPGLYQVDAGIRPRGASQGVVIEFIRAVTFVNVQTSFPLRGRIYGSTHWTLRHAGHEIRLSSPEVFVEKA